MGWVYGKNLSNDPKRQETLSPRLCGRSDFWGTVIYIAQRTWWLEHKVAEMARSLDPDAVL